MFFPKRKYKNTAFDTAAYSLVIRAKKMRRRALEQMLLCTSERKEENDKTHRFCSLCSLLSQLERLCFRITSTKCKFPCSLKGGDPAAPSDTATLLRLHPSHRSYLRRLLPLQVSAPTLGTPNSHGVTGGVYKTRERIHPDMLIRDY